MKRKQLELEFSPRAKWDIQDIFDYSYFKFGEVQTLKYLEELDSKINALRLYPEMGVKRTEIFEDCFSMVCKSHIIFYQHASDKIIILRVLHHSRDSENLI